MNGRSLLLCINQQTGTPEEQVRADTDIREQQSYTRFAAAPATSGGLVVAMKRDRTCLPRRWAARQHSGLTEVCSVRGQASRRVLRCRSRVETILRTQQVTGEPGLWQIDGWSGSVWVRWNSSTQLWKHGPSWKHQSRDICPGRVLIWQTARNRCRHVWVAVESGVAVAWSHTTAPRFLQCSVQLQMVAAHPQRDVVNAVWHVFSQRSHCRLIACTIDLCVVSIEMREESCLWMSRTRSAVCRLNCFQPLTISHTDDVDCIEQLAMQPSMCVCCTGQCVNCTVSTGLFLFCTERWISSFRQWSVALLTWPLCTSDRLVIHFCYRSLSRCFNVCLSASLSLCVWLRVLCVSTRIILSGWSFFIFVIEMLLEECCAWKCCCFSPFDFEQ